MFKHGVNSFINAISSNFGLAGNKADTIKEYIPAVVFTLYDGYYIYAPYTNTNYLSAGVDKNGETYHGLKPYIYYSARYINGVNNDFVITYTLDNFITIQGTVNGNYVDDSGYIIDINKYSENGDGSVNYRGAKISSETLTENYANVNATSSSDAKVVNYPYYKYNGTKYYYDSSANQIFYILNGKKLIQYAGTKATDTYNNEIVNNKAAINFYKKAYDFTNKVLNTYNLSNLNSSWAVKPDGTKMFDNTDNYKVFANNCNNVEYSNSNFNEQRLAVIRYQIESNLSSAINGFQTYAHSTSEYILPKISEDQWSTIENNISVISFMQGLNIGTKQYNGYQIVVNNLNKELVSEECIYINTDNGSGNKEYHRVNDTDITSSGTVVSGSLSIDYELNSFFNSNTNETVNFYPRSEMGCYRSIVNQYNTVSYSDLYQYMDSGTVSQSVKNAYFTALARERYTMFRIGESVT